MVYGHGGDIYTYENMLDFSVNLNPLGPPQRCDRCGETRSGTCVGIS